MKAHGYQVSDHWYQHSPETVLDDEDKPKILWDFNFMTDREIEHRRPDIVVFKKDPRECHLIDVAIPGDQNIAVKEVEKIANYAELKVEVTRMWRLPPSKVTVIPVIVGALGSIPAKLKSYLDQLGIDHNINVLHKSALLGTAHILRKVLSV